MSSFFRLTTPAVLLASLLSACGGGGDATPPGTSPTSQTITFNSPGDQVSGTTTALSATATSSLPVSFSTTTPSVCTVSGTTLSLLSSGSCTIEANQSGNGSYSAAAPVSRTVAVNGLVFSSGYTTFKEVSPGANYYEGGTAQGGRIGLFSGAFENYDNTYTGGGYTDDQPAVAAADTYFYIAITTSAPSNAGYLGMYVTYAAGGLQLGNQTKLKLAVAMEPKHFAQASNKDFKVVIEAVGSGCSPAVSRTVTPTSSDLTTYTLPLSSFTVSQDCGNAALTVANVLALPVNAVNTLFESPNINNTQINGTVYPTAITRGSTTTFE